MTTTIRPDVPVMVDEAAWTDLHRQGLLASGGYTGFIPTAAYPHHSEIDSEEK